MMFIRSCVNPLPANCVKGVHYIPRVSDLSAACTFAFIIILVSFIFIIFVQIRVLDCFH